MVYFPSYIILANNIFQFSYKLADRTLEKGGKYAEQPGIEIDKEYRARIEAHVKQWVKDEKYCKKKLVQFRKEYAQLGMDGESPAGAKGDRSSSQPSASQPGSSRDTEDSPMINGINGEKDGNGIGSLKSTPASGSSPLKRSREDEDEERDDYDGRMEQTNGDHSPTKKSKSGSPTDISPGAMELQSMDISTQSDSLPETPGLQEVLKLSLPVMGTPTKREREEDDDFDGATDMKDTREGRVVKKVRSRSNSSSRGFEDELRRQPAAVHTGA